MQDMKLQDMKLQDKKLQDMKMQDMKMQDMKMTTGREVATEKNSFNRGDKKYSELCKFLNPQHCTTLCIRDYLFLKNVKKCCKNMFCFSILHIIMKHKTQK